MRPESRCFCSGRPRVRARVESAAALVEREEYRVFVALGRCNGVGQRERRLADAGRADKQRIGPPLETSAEKLVELGIAARRVVSGELLVMLGGDETREDIEPAGLDREIVEASSRQCRAS